MPPPALVGGLQSERPAYIGQPEISRPAIRRTWRAYNKPRAFQLCDHLADGTRLYTAVPSAPVVSCFPLPSESSRFAFGCLCLRIKNRMIWLKSRKLIMSLSLISVAAYLAMRCARSDSLSLRFSILHSPDPFDRVLPAQREILHKASSAPLTLESIIASFHANIKVP